MFNHTHTLKQNMQTGSASNPMKLNVSIPSLLYKGLESVSFRKPIGMNEMELGSTSLVVGEEGFAIFGVVVGRFWQYWLELRVVNVRWTYL